MSIPQHGRDAKEILAELHEMKSGDVDWRGGKIFAYTFNAGAEAEQLVKDAYCLFLTENGIDFMSFPSLVRLERDVVRFIAELLRGGDEAVGNFTSGGTESIFLAVKSARDMARAKRPEITQPEMVFPRTAHCAFYKAGQYLGVKPVVADFDPATFKADVDSMRRLITDNTVLLCASAPAYAQGVVDPVPEIGALALERGLPLHVDACMGGIMLSVMRGMDGYGAPDFDFSVPGVTSISADMHKFGYSAKGASTIVYRDKELRRHQIFAKTCSTTYALVNPTFLSSKSGGPMAAAWAMIRFLGREGYEKIFREVMDAVRRMIDGINATGDLYVLGKPDMCIFSFASETLNVFQLADWMKGRGWYLQPQFSTDRSTHNLHVTLMRTNVGRVDEFLADLKDGVAAVKAMKNKIDMNAVRSQVRTMIDSFGAGALDQLTAMAGIGGAGGGLPEDMALISSILDALPKDISEALLVDFANDLFV